MLVASISMAGLAVGFVSHYFTALTWTVLQAVFAISVTIPAVIAVWRRPASSAPWRPQLLGVLAPTVLLGVLLLVITFLWNLYS